MKLPGVRPNEGRRGNGEEISLYDRCSVYLQLVEVQLALQKTSEAATVMRQAIFDFSNTTQEGRVTIMNAQVELHKGEVEKALTMLRAVPPTNPHYHTARKALADLYYQMQIV